MAWKYAYENAKKIPPLSLAYVVCVGIAAVRAGDISFAKRLQSALKPTQDESNRSVKYRKILIVRRSESDTLTVEYADEGSNYTAKSSVDSKSLEVSSSDIVRLPPPQTVLESSTLTGFTQPLVSLAALPSGALALVVLEDRRSEGASP